MRSPPRLLWLALVAGFAGLVFASFSTYDFVQHLDRQVHGLHCSFLPGLGGTDVSGSSGCHVTLMSPYSSIFRTSIWGGLPIAMPAMAVFAFLLFAAAEMLVNGRGQDASATAFLALAWALPTAASMVMGWISFSELGAACKLCLGIYGASLCGLGGAVAQWRSAKSAQRFAAWEDDFEERGSQEIGFSGQLARFAIGVGFVILPVGAYAGLAPEFERYVGTCGNLESPEDTYDIMIDLDGNTGGVEAIEILDPLCPSCRGLENRLEASGMSDQLNRKAVLFPLDSTCNRSVPSTLHPGACSLSEALLCADSEAPAVLEWAFENHDEIRMAAEEDATAARRMVVEAFPDLRGCVGSSRARSRLNRSLRWAIKNALPVMTPQLYIDGEKLCDEDTDLGLDFALSRMLGGAGGTP